MNVVLKIAFLKSKPVEHVINVHGMIVIGRSNKADIVIDDPKISGVHCRLHFKKDKLELTDLESKNGTYLNGIKMENSSVFIGDTVKFGSTLITIEPKKMNRESIELLTFSGSDRFDATARHDYTSVVTNKPKTLPVDPNIKFVSKPRPAPRANLSKQVVKSQHKTRASVAILIDVLLLIFFACLPVLIFDYQNKEKIEISKLESNKMFFVLGVELVCVIGFFLLNFKVLKFSIGERVSGIKKFCA
ncbi:MAG TPA: FHA domain-containing protein [Bacteriovoracaceae bacterium]|nr:FHA domain-containing protein [Bacteriovoracaceae bacterium]